MLPVLLGIAAAVSGVAGVGAGIHGGVKMKEASDTSKSAERRHKANVERLHKSNDAANQTMDTLGKLELSILKDFESFSDMIEKIQNRPEFKAYDRKGVTLPKFEPGKIREAAVGAGVVLGGLGGAAAGTAGGFAAAGATTSAVMALGAASTGTAISSLSGAAATNATLAAIGGGALEAGGGGIALGTSILGGMTLGVGLLVGGVIFSATGSKMSDKADEAWRQMREAEKKIDKACEYLDGLTKTAGEYTAILQKAKIRYDELFQPLNYLVTVEGKTNWSKFTAAEKRNMENLVLLVGLLYKMCQVQLVLKQFEDDEEPQVNYEGTRQAEQEAEQILKEVA
jgi:hypothetical protein